MKKILIFVNDLSFFISHRLPVAEASFNKGFEVTILYGELGGANLNFLRKKGFKLKYIPIQRGGINIISDIKSIYNVWKFFKKIKPDIVHTVTIKPYLYGGIISRITSVPCLVSAISGFGSLFISKDYKSRILRLMLYPIYYWAFNHPNQKVIIQNKDDANTLVKWKILNFNKIELIKGSGVNLAHFKNLNEPKGIPVICFAARLLRDKGIYDFISAAKILNLRNIKARFLIAGNLDKKNPSSLTINNLKKIKKNKYLEFLGHHVDIPKLYSKSHIICLPSYREGLPKSLLEAGAAGRAIVTTNVPGCRDAILPNKTGLVVPLKDPKKLADTIQWLVENPKKRIAMGKAGRKYTEKEFRIEKIVKLHLKIYKKLINKTY